MSRSTLPERGASGTGTLACLLAGHGVRVTAADPAAASLEVARRKPGAGSIRWLHAAAAALPPLQVNLATMTGNVAQVFVTDEEWSAALGAVREALRPGAGWCSRARDASDRPGRELVFIARRVQGPAASRRYRA